MGFAFLMLSLIAFLVYRMEYNLQQELCYAKMSESAQRIASRLTHAHMQGKKLDFSKLKIERGYRYGLYDSDHRPRYTQIDHPVDFSQKYFQHADHLGVVDRSAFGHMGIDYVVVEGARFKEMMHTLLWKVLLVFTLLFTLVALIGYRLAKLFIMPIHNERTRLDTFVKGSTHELNTPITALLMSVNHPQPCSEKNLERIRMSARRISQIYEDLTYLFLRDTQEKPATATPIALDAVLRDQIAVYQPFLQRKGVALSQRIEPMQIVMDTESAVRLCSNLISNALKYTHKGGSIEITLERGMLIVADDGIGIETDKQREIFRRFYRATMHAGGFGIGLDMVRSICDRYAIAIALESEVGKGSRFILTCPKEILVENASV